MGQKDVLWVKKRRVFCADTACLVSKRGTGLLQTRHAVLATTLCRDGRIDVPRRCFRHFGTKSCRDFLRGSELESDARPIAFSEESDTKKARLECQPDSKGCRNRGARLVVHPDECVLIAELQVDFVAKLDVVAVALLVDFVDDAVGEVGLGQRELDFFHTACCYISRFFVANLLRKPMHPYIH